jgi:hypothetical protein
MSRRRKLKPMTGDAESDAFAQMHNDQIRVKKKRSAMNVYPYEYHLITQILPKYKCGKIVCPSESSAGYIKVRLRAILKDNQLNEFIGSSTQGREILVWIIAHYNRWKVSLPVEKCPMYLESRAEEVTVYSQSNRSGRNIETDISEIEKRIAQMDTPIEPKVGVKSKSHRLLSQLTEEEPPMPPRINISVIRKVVEGNLASGLITQEEYDEKMKELDQQEGL